MPGPPATVDVEVEITNIPAGAAGQVAAILHSGIGDGTPARPLNFRNNGHPGFIVRFHIVDLPAGPPLLFPNNPNDALWVRPLIDPLVDSCPGAQCMWAQFEPQAVADRRKMLIVRNRNECTQKFGFRLNLEQAAGAGPPFWFVDPIGNNQNGPQ